MDPHSQVQRVCMIFFISKLHLRPEDLPRTISILAFIKCCIKKNNFHDMILPERQYFYVAKSDNATTGQLMKVSVTG